MIKKLSLIALLGIFAFSCKTKHKVTYGKGNTTAEVKTKRKIAPQNQFKGGPYALPDDTGKFMRYEINSVDMYIDFFSETAQLEMQAYSIPASITLAQGLLESGLGKGELAMKSNNHFGIKCHSNWTGDYVLHDDDENDECFRKYNHPMYSYRDHSMFLSSRSRYASLFDLDVSDYKGWARGLQKAGYATDKKYPEKLISLIERYGLQRFDTFSKDDAPVTKQTETSDVTWVQEDPKEVLEEVVPENPRSNISTPSENLMHTVVKGDSLWAISRTYGVTVSELRKWNGLSNNDLSIGQQLVIEKN